MSPRLTWNSRCRGCPLPNPSRHQITENELRDLLLSELQKIPAERLTNAELTRITGVSERTIRRRKAKLRQQYTQPTQPTQPTQHNPNTQLPPNATPTKGKISRFTPGEGWDSIEYTLPVQDAPDVLNLEQVLEPLTAAADTPIPSPAAPAQPPNQDKAFVIAFSDLQVGKTDELGGTEELSRRLASVFSQIENHLASQPTYGEIVFADTGDLLEGFGNTVAQQQTNDLSLTDQIRFAQRVVVEAIRRFMPYAPKFTYVAVPSNHCAVRTGTGSKSRSNAPNDDWGLLIQDNIRTALATLPEYQHIEFVQPSKWEEATTHTTVDGTVMGFAHGHQWGVNKAGDWLAKMAVGKRSNLQNADLLLHGHYHSFTLSLVGAGQHVIGAPTIDNGSSWFSNASGISSPASMLTFVAAGNTSRDWVLWEPGIMGE